MTLSNIKVTETGSTIFPEINEENIQWLIKDVFKGGKFNDVHIKYTEMKKWLIKVRGYLYNSYADVIFFAQHTLVFMLESRPGVKHHDSYFMSE
jgi:hypothetical protein